MTMAKDVNDATILLAVEDSEADARLIRESLKDGAIDCRLCVVEDGEKAMAFLRREGRYADAPRPNVIILDLNLPRKDGREVLAEVKADSDLRRIPVTILSSSADQQDIRKAYDAGANCYVVKPIGLDEFVSTTQSLVRFWLEVVKLPES